MSRYTRVKSASSSFSASLTQRHYKGSSEYSRDASTELLGHPNWAANLLALTRSASWFVKSLHSQKKEFGVDGHFVVPIENIFEKIFSLNLSNRRTRGGHICFLIRILFPVFVFFYLFIYSSTFHSSSFSWMAHGNIKHLGGCWLFSAADAPGFLFIFFHFPSRFTPRYDILNCMSGRENGHKKRKQSQQNKREKPFLGWKEVMIQYGDHTARRTRRKYFWSASAVSIVFFDCFPYLKQHSFCGLFFFYSPQTVDRNKTEWCLFPFILKVIASVARGTNRRIAAKENRRRSRRWTSRWTCESYVSKCVLTVSVGQRQLGGGSSYRIRCRTRSAITVRLVGSPVNYTTVHISFFFMNRFQLHKARVFFLSSFFYRGRAFHFRSALFGGWCRCPSSSSVL